MDANFVVAAIGAIPGLGALVGAAVGYGALRQRIKTMEADVQDLKKVGTEVAVIAERTKNTDEGIKGVTATLNTITNHLLGEARSFRPPVPPIIQA